MILFKFVHHDDDDGEIPEPQISPKKAISHEESTNEHQNIELVTSEGFEKYINKHGYHFTPELAEHVSNMMRNMSEATHTWSCNAVMSAIHSLGDIIPKHVTPGDLTYLANMAYADFYPSVLDEEVLCIRYAIAVAKDKDGYEGMPFYRWLADVMATDGKVDWDQFI